MKQIMEDMNCITQKVLKKKAKKQSELRMLLNNPRIEDTKIRFNFTMAGLCFFLYLFASNWNGILKCVYIFQFIDFNQSYYHSAKLSSLIQNVLKRNKFRFKKRDEILLFNSSWNVMIGSQDTDLALDMNGIHQVLTLAVDINLIGDDIGIIERNSRMLLNAYKGLGLAVNIRKN